MTELTIWEQLAEPFDAKQEKVMPQSVSVKPDGTASAMGLTYVDSRAVGERLDTVLSPENWTFDWTPLSDGGAKGTISINVGMIFNYAVDKWISKSDVGYPNEEGDKEALKGAVSDALKRTAVLFGVGRYLYNLDKSWYPCETFTGKDGKPKFKKWIKEPVRNRPAANSAARNTGGATVATTNVPAVETKPMPAAAPKAAAKSKTSEPAGTSSARANLVRGLARAKSYPIDVTKYAVEESASDDEVKKVIKELAVELVKYEIMNEDDSDWQGWLAARALGEEKGISLPPESSFKIPMERETVIKATASVLKVVKE